ncbi:3-hydroxybutyrate dehydrogenase type 2-like [Homarus americanus]|uniref:3-hydroxybutyrate dehydrogenase type 2-like n=1 Tax=Homarus americanus TaxID=6706 RepID=UPI001C464C07|nr:3-hydroxybutyrate dehydrogenase type 2-like [Homarus americanus]
MAATIIFVLLKLPQLPQYQLSYRCNVICPSPVATPSYSERAQDLNDSDKTHIDYMRDTMIGRLAYPEEVANLCVYLASDESSYHTGNVFTIDGGFCL